MHMVRERRVCEGDITEVKGSAGQGRPGEVKLVLATAKILAEAGRGVRDARNEEQQRWELAQGISQRKDKVRKREWKEAP